MSAKHKDILAAVVTVIKALSLSGVSSANITEGKLPLDRNLTLPSILCSQFGSEQMLPGTCGSDDYGYPVLVVIVSAGNQNNATSDTELQWRQSIRNAFHNKRLSGVSAVWKCVVEPGEIVSPAEWRDSNLTVSALTVRAITREVRA